jgi:hypothetical protein
MPDQPQKKIRADEEDKKEGFWSRLFGKRKK